MEKLMTTDEDKEDCQCLVDDLEEKLENLEVEEGGENN